MQCLRIEDHYMRLFELDEENGFLSNWYLSHFEMDGKSFTHEPETVEF